MPSRAKADKVSDLSVTWVLMSSGAQLADLLLEELCPHPWAWVGHRLSW